MVMVKRRGFTLIELLVTIAIISVLSGIGLAAFIGAQKKARDGRRQADLEQIRSALELYRSNEGNGLYPGSLGLLTADYLSPLSTDPKSGDFYNSGYGGTNCGAGGCPGYTLTWGQFETTMTYLATEKGVTIGP
jgi:general secretion pathway protein G